MATSAMAWQPSDAPIKVVVGQSPGGGNEYAMRGIAPSIEKANPKVTFIIDHRPGLDNVIALNYFAKQKPDGQTILVVNQEAAFVAAPVAYKNQLQADPTDFTLVTNIGRAPMAFIVPENSPIKTVPQLIAYLQDKNNKFNIGVSGSVVLLTYSYFVNKIGVDKERVQAIPYQSAMAATIDVAGSKLDMAIVPVSIPRPMVGTKIRLLGHTGSVPIAGIEKVSLIKNHVPELEINASWAVFLPPNTPPDITKWYVEQFQQASSTPDTIEYFRSGWAVIDPTAQGPAGLAASIYRLKKHWYRLAEETLNKNN
jgi:tripartite-type tricarboxylate transporter receptor subunit TctC